MDADPIGLLVNMFREMGADEAQAITMSQQLWKRAGQIAQEQDVTQEEALKGLLVRMKEVKEQS